MINKERVQFLVDDLMTTTELQGQNRLAYKDIDGNMRYCCLGRACEVAITHGLELSTAVNENAVIFYDGDTGVMLPSVAQWYGFPDGNPDVSAVIDGTKVEIVTLAELNDGGAPALHVSHTFQQIGQIIKENFLD